MELAKIISSIFKTLRGAPGKSLVVNASGFGEKSFECELFSVPGIIGKPADGVQGIEIRVGGLRFIIATHNYKFDKELNKGETIVYSIDDDGVIQGQAHFDNTGQMIINEGTDYAVKYNELETAFNQLKSDFDSHVHSDVTSGSSYTGTTTPSTANISPAKVEKVRL